MAVPMGEITRALAGVRRRLCVKWGFVDMDVYEQEYRFYYFARCPYPDLAPSEAVGKRRAKNEVVYREFAESEV